jgi:hypothetical protein
MRTYMTQQDTAALEKDIELHKALRHTFQGTYWWPPQHPSNCPAPWPLQSFFYAMPAEEISS